MRVIQTTMDKNHSELLGKFAELDTRVSRIEQRFNNGCASVRNNAGLLHSCVVQRIEYQLERAVRLGAMLRAEP